jgi:hypothetical protein
MWTDEMISSTGRFATGASASSVSEGAARLGPRDRHVLEYRTIRVLRRTLETVP